jgi:hypothetical protein
MAKRCSKTQYIFQILCEIFTIVMHRSGVVSQHVLVSATRVGVDFPQPVAVPYFVAPRTTTVKVRSRDTPSKVTQATLVPRTSCFRYSTTVRCG